MPVFSRISVVDRQAFRCLDSVFRVALGMMFFDQTLRRPASSVQTHDPDVPRHNRFQIKPSGRIQIQ